MLSRVAVQTGFHGAMLNAPFRGAELVFKNFFQHAAASGKLCIPIVEATDQFGVIAGRDVSAAAVAVLQHFDRYAGQAGPPCIQLLWAAPLPHALTATSLTSVGKKDGLQRRHASPVLMASKPDVMGSRQRE